MAGRGDGAEAEWWSDDGAEDDEEEEEEEEGDEMRCLFCADAFRSSAAVFAHCRAAHGFAFEARGLYAAIKLVNLARRAAADLGAEAAAAALEADRKSGRLAERLDDETLLRPALPNDALLADLAAFDDGDDDADADAGDGQRVRPDADAEAVVEELRDEVRALRAALLQMRASFARVVDGQRPRDEAKAAADTVDAPYFAGYSQRDIHEEMLRDVARTTAYRDAFERNRAFFGGRAVLDVGCGTGVLSMFAARAGAARVVGLDGAEIVDKAREIVALNGFADRVTLVKTKVEDWRCETRFDVIVSEWMGYFLLFESMLPSVLYARDHWLADGGVVLPSVARLLVAGSSAQHDPTAFWRDVYGLDMTPLVSEAERHRDCTVEIVDAATRVTSTAEVASFDMASVQEADLDFEATVELEAEADGRLACFVVHFDCEFSLEERVSLTTAPDAAPTHWKQTVFPLVEPLELRVGDRVALTLKAARKADNHRHYSVDLSWVRSRGRGQPPLQQGGRTYSI